VNRGGELPRSVERRRAAALARHFRDDEGLVTDQIAECLGRSTSTVRSYLSDPDGAKERAAKRRWRGWCRRCGARTSAGDGKRKARRLCASCRASAQASSPR
jgi:hypothetical protein